MIAVLGASAVVGCGGDSGGSADGPEIAPRILGETLARDIQSQYDKSSAVQGCRKTGDRKYECVAREEGDGTQALLWVSIDKSDRYRATSSVTGVAITGSYPKDTAYRGLDLAALMREVFAQGKRQGKIPADVSPDDPACEVNVQEDRTYECYVESTRDVVVAVDGSFKVPPSGGAEMEFSGQLPKSFGSQPD